MARAVQAFCVSLLLTVAPLGLAEESPQMPQATAEHEALEMWVGDWTGRAQMKESPFGPAGPVEWTEECSWFSEAKFHVVCKSEGTGPLGEMKGLGIMGYDPVKGVYTHYGIDSTGWEGHSEGTREKDTWSFRSKETMGGETFHSRFQMEMLSPERMSFLWQTSEDGETWVTLMEGTTEKR